MRILSKFHDYYDTVQAFGADESDVWIRNSAVVEVVYRENPFSKNEAFSSLQRNVPWKRRGVPGWQAGSEAATVSLVLFCGKPHLIYTASIPMMVENEFGRKINTFVKVVTTNISKLPSMMDHKVFDAHYELKDSNKRRRSFYWYEEKINFIDSLGDLNEIHRRYDTPILHLRPADLLNDKGIDANRSISYVVETNPNLSKLDFARLYEPWVAAQEIEMYRNSMLARDQDKMVKLSDKEVHAKHGFDKWSFRKMKGG